MKAKNFSKKLAEFLPHGREFRFIDKVLSIKDTEATAEFIPRANSPILQAHFPANPIVPAVVMIEAIAQLGGVIVQEKLAKDGKARRKALRVVAVKNAKFTNEIKAGKLMLIHGKIVDELGAIFIIRGSCSVQAKTSNGDESKKKPGKKTICARAEVWLASP